MPTVPGINKVLTAKNVQALCLEA